MGSRRRRRVVCVFGVTALWLVLSIPAFVFAQAAAVAGPLLIVPGQGMGPIRLGMTVAQVRAALGHEQRSTTDPVTGAIVLAWDTKGGGHLGVWFGPDGKVINIGINQDPQYATAKGLRPGDAANKVTAVMGPPDAVSSRPSATLGLLQILQYPGILFYVPSGPDAKLNAKVYSIIVGAPSASTATSPVAPAGTPPASSQPAPPAQPAAPAATPPPTQVAPAQVSPPPAAAPSPAPPAAAPASSVPLATDRLYIVRIGITDQDRANAVAKQLAAAGYSQPQVDPQTIYRVLSEPLPRQSAERLAASLASRGLRVYTETLTGDTVQLVFGTFASQKDAEALSARVAAAGSDAWVREAPGYVLHLGPYPQSAVTAIGDIVHAHTPEAAVTTDGAPLQSAPAASATAPGAPAAPAPQSPPAPAVVAAPTPSVPAAPASNQSFMVRIGPVSDHDRADAVAKQLFAGGFGQAQITSQAGYRVVSEPLPRTVAEGLIITLSQHGFRAYLAPLTGDSVQLLFGIYTTQQDAEALSGRIAAAGYDAWVRSGPVYILRLGPHPQAAVNAITGIVRAGAPEAAVTTDPASTP